MGKTEKFTFRFERSEFLKLKIFENCETETTQSTCTMSTLDEVYDLESQKENFEIVDDYSQRPTGC